MTVSPTMLSGNLLPGGLVFDGGLEANSVDTLRVQGTRFADAFAVNGQSVAANRLAIRLAGVEQVRIEGGKG